MLEEEEVGKRRGQDFDRNRKVIHRLHVTFPSHWNSFAISRRKRTMKTKLFSKEKFFLFFILSCPFVWTISFSQMVTEVKWTGKRTFSISLLEFLLPTPWNDVIKFSLLEKIHFSLLWLYIFFWQWLFSNNRIEWIRIENVRSWRADGGSREKNRTFHLVFFIFNLFIFSLFPQFLKCVYEGKRLKCLLFYVFSFPFFLFKKNTQYWCMSCRWMMVFERQVRLYATSIHTIYLLNEKGLGIHNF